MAAPSKPARPPADWSERYRESAAASTCSELKDFYSAGMIDAATPLARVPFVALDLETTGLDPATCAVVSIGLVPFDLKRIRPAESAYWVIQPDQPLAEESVVIHHLTHAELRRAPGLNQVFPDVLPYLAGRVPVVHYRQIERPFLDQACRKWFGEPFRCPMVDTLALEAWARHRQRTAMQRLGDRLGLRRRPSVRLAAARKRYHLPVYSAHHALTDALATAELFQAQVAHHFDPGLAVGQLWL